MKRKICMVTVIIMVLSMISPVAAVGGEQLVDDEFVAREISNLIPSLLAEGEFGVTTNNCDNLYVGEAIVSYVLEDGVIVDSYLQYPIIHSEGEIEEIIGLSTIVEYNSMEPNNGRLTQAFPNSGVIVFSGYEGKTFQNSAYMTCNGNITEYDLMIE